MKRSSINRAIATAKNILTDVGISLPEFAYWDCTDWYEHRDQLDYIIPLMLGWDVSDYNTDNFSQVGGVLFTLRNGNPSDARVGVPYAEKYIILLEGQGLPMHFHHVKTEDIINRSGGILSMELYHADNSNNLDMKTPVAIRRDGILYTYSPGEVISVKKGESITLPPRLYHRFWAAEGYGNLVVGEVSSINNDHEDNYFHESVPRFSSIYEDEPRITYLCNELHELLR